MDRFATHLADVPPIFWGIIAVLPFFHLFTSSPAVSAQEISR